jgi:hypothetical protein
MYVLLFRRWRDLAAKKRKEAQKQILLISSENKLFHLQIYIMLNTIFVSEIFHLMPYCIFFIV